MQIVYFFAMLTTIIASQNPKNGICKRNIGKIVHIKNVNRSDWNMHFTAIRILTRNFLNVYATCEELKYSFFFKC